MTFQIYANPVPKTMKCLSLLGDDRIHITHGPVIHTDAKQEPCGPYIALRLSLPFSLSLPSEETSQLLCLVAQGGWRESFRERTGLPVAWAHRANDYHSSTPYLLPQAWKSLCQTSPVLL